MQVDLLQLLGDRHIHRDGNFACRIGEWSPIAAPRIVGA
jgi:hypothetical protein